MTWFKELKTEVKAFFEKATKKEIQEALEKANYALYKKIDLQIVDLHEIILSCESLGMVTFRQSLKDKYTLSAPVATKRRISFKEMEVSTSSADNYGYALAA